MLPLGCSLPWAVTVPGDLNSEDPSTFWKVPLSEDDLVPSPCVCPDLFAVCPHLQRPSRRESWIGKDTLCVGSLCSCSQVMLTKMTAIVEFNWPSVQNIKLSFSAIESTNLYTSLLSTKTQGQRRCPVCPGPQGPWRWPALPHPLLLGSRVATTAYPLSSVLHLPRHPGHPAPCSLSTRWGLPNTGPYFS